MLNFGAMSLESAKEYCRYYAAGAPLRSGWLIVEAVSTGCDPVDVADAGSLDPLWKWFRERLDENDPKSVELTTPLPADDPQAGPHPPWLTGDSHPFLSFGALWIIDALGCHLAALAKASVPEAEWQVYRAPTRRKDVNQNRTKLANLPCGTADPARMVYGEVIRYVHNGEEWLSGALENLYQYLVAPSGEWKPIR